MAVDNQVLVAALGVYVGLLIHSFFSALMRDLVLPALSPVASVENGVSKLVVQVAGVKLNVGDVIVQTANILVALAVVSYAVPYLKEYVPVAGKR
jgi:hypothetical protein